MMIEILEAALEKLLEEDKETFYNSLTVGRLMNTFGIHEASDTDDIVRKVMYEVESYEREDELISEFLVDILY